MLLSSVFSVYQFYRTASLVLFRENRECSRITSPIQVPIGSYFLRWLFLLKNLQFLNIQFRYFSGDKTKNILVDSLGLKKLTKTWKGHFCPCWRKNFILVYAKSTVLIRFLAKNQKYILIGSFELTLTFNKNFA